MDLSMYFGEKNRVLNHTCVQYVVLLPLNVVSWFIFVASVAVGLILNASLHHASDD